MPTGNLTLLDIAKKNGSDALVGLIEETQVSSPEIELGAARTIKGISYKTLVRVSLPKGGFRGANEGTPGLKSEYANKSFEAMIFNPQWDCDKAVAEADEDGKEACIAREADGILRGALIHLGSQFYYGTANDVKGCPGLIAQYDAANMTVDATGSGNATTSVWAVKFGPQYTQWLWGNDGQLALSDVIEQKKQDADGNYYTALFQEILARVGLQVGSRHSVARLKNISTAAGKTVTDALLFKLLNKFPTGIVPDMLLMNRDALEQLRSSRTATNPTGAPAPIPTEVGGVAIRPTDSITFAEVAA